MIRIKKLLSDFKEAFKPFSGTWNEWATYEGCGLSEREKYSIDVLQKNNFRLGIDHLFMFYAQSNELTLLIYKLKQSEPAFREWLVIKFQFALIKIAFEQDKSGLNTSLQKEKCLEDFFTDKIENLNIGPSLKTCLLKFNKQNLDDIIALDLQNNDGIFNLCNEAYTLIIKSRALETQPKITSLTYIEDG